MTHSTERLLAGPPLAGRAETYDDHVHRLGLLPSVPAGQMLGALDATGLLGRGGAGFPVGRKWRSVAQAHGTPVVVANGAEGEPESAKDRVLMAHRPHLVIDGAVLAARTTGADRIELYLGREHAAAVRAMRAAVEERPKDERRMLHIVEAPIGYVAGESTAVVHYVNSKDARPLATPPRMSERGVRNRPTLVQNVESLAHAALIARYGPAWYREAGRGENRGTALITIVGPVRHEGVAEIELGTPFSEVVELAGGFLATPQAVLIGGYFGAWASMEQIWNLPLDPASLRAEGLSFGCGLVRVLDARTCGVDVAARIMAFLAAASANQCGPCRFGLPALASAAERVAANLAKPDDLENIERWNALVTGRGACRHPDGAAKQLSSAMAVFADDVASHASRGRCLASAKTAGGVQ